MSMKLTISCDTTTTQAGTPYSSSMSTSALMPSRDILQISATPLSSIGSIPKNEILTFTTDYNNRSPDTRSILVDVVDQHDPSLTFNRDLQLSIEESFDLPQRSISSSIRNDYANRARQSGETWRFGKCLCCTAPIDDEVSMFYIFFSRFNINFIHRYFYIFLINSPNRLIRYHIQEKHHRHIHRYTLVQQQYYIRDHR
ncbi:hypothetical protein M0802_006763 [Mischocyttarus mexicanus]|nr:hypothetical protein M0802_006763 [Mischocyttarus mexicanus]